MTHRADDKRRIKRRDPDSIVEHELISSLDVSKKLALNLSALDWLDAREKAAQSVIRDLGLSSDPGLFQLAEVSQGQWRLEVALGEERTGSPEWYAANEILAIKVIRLAIARGDILAALQAQQRLGDLIRFCELEHGVAGRNLIASRRERRRKSAGGQRKPRAAEQWRQLADIKDAELRDDRKTRSKSERAAIIRQWLRMQPSVTRVPAERTIREHLR